MDTDGALAQLAAIQRRGTGWLTAQVDADGRPAGAELRNGWYHLPLTLAQTGQRPLAARVLSWIEREALDGGDLAEGFPRAGWISRAASNPLSVIAQAASMLERYDTAEAILDRLGTYQVAGSGGAYSERHESRTSDRQFLYATANLGIAAVMGGRKDMATGVLRWCAELWRVQPGPEHVLYTSWLGGRLETDPPEELRQRSVVDFSQRRQSYCNVGIAVAFLVRYHLRFGSAEALELARNYLACNTNGCAEQYDHSETTQISEYGLALALIALCGSDDAARADVRAELVRMVEWFAASQRADGSWLPSGFLVPSPTISNALEKTSEHLSFVAVMRESLEAIRCGRGAKGGPR